MELIGVVFMSVMLFILIISAFLGLIFVLMVLDNEILGGALVRKLRKRFGGDDE